MIKIKEAVIVEGKYDVIKLSRIVDTLIIKTDGFGIFKDKEKQQDEQKTAQEFFLDYLADTAGIHETDDTVEKFGVTKAKEKIDNAELLLAVFDNSVPLDHDDRQLLDNILDKKCIIILNKTDLEPAFNKNDLGNFEIVEVSAKIGDGFDTLAKSINHVCKTDMLSPDDTVLINERQRDCVSRAQSAICAARDALLCGMTLDAVGVCVDDAIASLLELTGKRVTNEVCDEIFKRFCVGK